MTAKAATLEASLATATDSCQRVDLLNALAGTLRDENPSRARALCKQAHALAAAMTPPYDQGVAESAYQLGVLNTLQGAYDIGFPLLTEAATIFSALNVPAGEAKATNAIGVLHLHLSDYTRALERFLLVLRLTLGSDDETLAATAYNNIGYLFLQTRQHTRSLHYLHKGLEITRRLKLQKEQADLLDNMAEAYRARGALEPALRWARTSLRLYRAMGSQKGEAEVLITIGDIYRDRNQMDQALPCYHNSLRIAKTLRLRHEVVRAMRKIGEAHLRREETEPAQTHLNRALTIARTAGLKRDTYECHRALAELHKVSGDLSRSLMHYEQYNAIRESVFTEEADQRQKHIEALHQVENARNEAKRYRQESAALQQEIRERRQVEEALRQANQQLQTEIKERERLIEDLDAFGQTVAHDLQAPLGLITGFSGLLADRLRGGDAQLLTYVEQIVKTGHKMSAIIDDLLLLARVRQEEIVPRPVNTGPIMRQVEARLSQLIARHQAEIIKPDKWPPVLGHAAWLEEVWTNYISNAIKYGGRPPRVQVGATPRPGGSVRFWVRDNGAGLPPEQQRQLFTPFTRLHLTQANGHGLGLSIVKRIVEKLGGTIAVESEAIPGRGCTFSFTLPAARPGALAQIPDSPI